MNYAASAPALIAASHRLGKGLYHLACGDGTESLPADLTQAVAALRSAAGLARQRYREFSVQLTEAADQVAMAAGRVAPTELALDDAAERLDLASRALVGAAREITPPRDEVDLPALSVVKRHPRHVADRAVQAAAVRAAAAQTRQLTLPANDPRLGLRPAWPRRWWVFWLLAALAAVILAVLL